MSAAGTSVLPSTRRAEVTLRWRAGALHRSLTGIVALGLGIALVLGRTDLVLLVAPSLGVLLVPVVARPRDRVRVRWWQSASAVLEGDRVEVAVDVAGGPVTGVVEGEVATARMPRELVRDLLAGEPAGPWCPAAGVGGGSGRCGCGSTTGPAC